MVIWFNRILIGVLLVATSVVGYQLTASHVVEAVYRERLANLSGEYDSLRVKYNQAVRKTAVTELIVTERHLSLAIRTIEGVRRVIDTPYDPTREIYCDYVLIDGRLWIRRVYDDLTPPSMGMLIDDQLEFVDWDNPNARYGNAVYRSLDVGRWIVTVTGDGSLGLAKAKDQSVTELSPPPPVYNYDQMQKQINDQIDQIGAGEVARYLTGSLSNG